MAKQDFRCRRDVPFRTASQQLTERLLKCASEAFKRKSFRVSFWLVFSLVRPCCFGGPWAIRNTAAVAPNKRILSLSHHITISSRHFTHADLSITCTVDQTSISFEYKQIFATLTNLTNFLAVSRKFCYEQMSV